MSPIKARKLACRIQDAGTIIFVISILEILFFSPTEHTPIIIFFMGIMTCLGTSVVFFIISLIFWRCPHCGAGFPIRRRWYDKLEKYNYCPYCNCDLKNSTRMNK